MPATLVYFNIFLTIKREHTPLWQNHNFDAPLHSVLLIIIRIQKTQCFIYNFLYVYVLFVFLNNLTYNLLMTQERRVDWLNRIDEMVIPLKPPVFAFEETIRTTVFKTLIAVMLSARTKDQVTEAAVTRLFSKIDGPKEVVQLSVEEVAELIYPVGFYKQKAKNILGIAAKVIEDGGVPDNFDELVKYPGVGRKTANLVMSLAYGVPSITVDIHVFRISKRLNWAKGDKPEIVEEELKKKFPEEVWNRLNQVLVGFGQTICQPRNPRCHECVLNKECPSSQVN